MTEDERERQILKTQFDYVRQFSEICKSLEDGFDDDRRAAEAMLRALSGDKSCRFWAMRFAVRRLGAPALRILLLAVKDVGNSKLRLVVRPRQPNEYPDKQARLRRFEQRWRTEEIGRTFYGLMKDGLAKRRAIAETRRLLRLNLSERSFERELAEFRRLVRKRGYVGDPSIGWNGTFSPRLYLSDLPKRGRPINRPMVEHRLEVFPPFSNRHKHSRKDV